MTAFMLVLIFAGVHAPITQELPTREICNEQILRLSKAIDRPVVSGSCVEFVVAEEVES